MRQDMALLCRDMSVLRRLYRGMALLCRDMSDLRRLYRGMALLCRDMSALHRLCRGMALLCRDMSALCRRILKWLLWAVSLGVLRPFISLNRATTSTERLLLRSGSRCAFVV